MPRVSVLMPVFNCVRYLKDALDSIAGQTLPDFEVIVVNDGSTDGSGELLAEYAAADPRFRIVTIPNGGIVGALNRGLIETSADLIVRMDGDDIAHSTRFARQVDHMDRHLDCVCVGSLYRVLDSEGKVVGGQAPFKHLPQTNLRQFPPRVTTLPHPSIMLRSQALRQIGGYRSKFPHAEDYDMFLRLARVGRLDVIQEHLLDYRIHENSVSSEHIQTQTDSSLLATLSAMVVEAGIADPAEMQDRPTFDDYYAVMPGLGFAQAFEDFRRFRVIESYFNRWRKAEGQKLAAVQLCGLLTQLPIRVQDRRYRGMLKASVRLLLRSMLGRA